MIKYEFGLGYRIKKFSVGQNFVLGTKKIEYNKTVKDYFGGDLLVISIIEAIIKILDYKISVKKFLQKNSLFKSNITSSSALKFLRKYLKKNNLKVDKIDSYIVVEKVKLKPYLKGIRKNIAENLGMKVKKLLISPTTADGVGPVGQGEAIEVITLVVLNNIE